MPERGNTSLARLRLPSRGGGGSSSLTADKPGPVAYSLGMLILGIILFGMIVGAGAQLILGRSHTGVDWTMAIAAGLVGSFLGGLVISLLSGDGLDL
jgi:hypothetical protein